jgi:hypothetical protein
MSVADDYGRFHSTPKLIRSACYPLQIDKVSDADIGKWLTECVTAALVSVYPASDGKRYVQIVKFGQQVRSKSKFPDPLQTPDNSCKQLLADVHLVGGVVEVEDVISNPKGLEVTANADDVPPAGVGEPINGTGSADRTPIQAIVAMYHAKLPSLRRCEKVTPARAGYIRQRWREDLTTLEAWENYLDYVGQSPFLMGRTQGSNGKPPFVADIEFLTKPASFTKIAEGKYHS